MRRNQAGVRAVRIWQAFEKVQIFENPGEFGIIWRASEPAALAGGDFLWDWGLLEPVFPVLHRV